MAHLAHVVGACEEPQGNQGQEDQWVTLESRVRLDPEDFLACLAFQDQLDQLALKETEDLLVTLGPQELGKRDLKVQRDHQDHLDHLVLVSQDCRASEDLQEKLVVVVCPVAQDLSDRLAIVSSARLSRCKLMQALRRKVEAEEWIKGRKQTKAYSQTKTAHRLEGSHRSTNPVIMFITMTFTMMAILMKGLHTAKEVTPTNLSHPAVFIQFLLLRLILVTSEFKWKSI